MKGLSDLRRELDSIDGEIAALLGRRMKIVDSIADFKAKSGTAVADPAREAEIIARVEALAGEGCAREARALFSAIFELSRARQKGRIGAKA